MLTLKVEFSPGTDISDAFQEATELASKIDVLIEFKFNDVVCFAKSGGKVRKGVAEYQESFKSKSPYKYAKNY